MRLLELEPGKLLLPLLLEARQFLIALHLDHGRSYRRTLGQQLPLVEVGLRLGRRHVNDIKLAVMKLPILASLLSCIRVCGRARVVELARRLSRNPWHKVLLPDLRMDERVLQLVMGKRFGEESIRKGAFDLVRLAHSLVVLLQYSINKYEVVPYLLLFRRLLKAVRRSLLTSSKRLWEPLASSRKGLVILSRGLLRTPRAALSWAPTREGLPLESSPGDLDASLAASISVSGVGDVSLALFEGVLLLLGWKVEVALDWLLVGAKVGHASVRISVEIVVHGGDRPAEGRKDVQRRLRWVMKVVSIELVLVRLCGMRGSWGYPFLCSGTALRLSDGWTHWVASRLQMRRRQFRRRPFVPQGLIEFCGGDRVCQVEGWLVGGTRSLGMFWLFTRATSRCKGLDGLLGVQVHGSLSASFGRMALHAPGVAYFGVARCALPRTLLQRPSFWPTHRAVDAWLNALGLAPLHDVLPRRRRVEVPTAVKGLAPAGILFDFEDCVWKWARVRRRLLLRSLGLLWIGLLVAVHLAADPLLSRQLRRQLTRVALV